MLGHLTKVFEILPEHYTITDYDVHIEDSTQSYQNMQSLVAISGELVKSGAADLADITNIITANGITELKKSINKSINKKKAENDMIGQLQQQVQQYEQSIQDIQKQNQQLQQQLQQAQSQLERNNQYKWELEAEKLSLEKERLRHDKEHDNKTIEVKKLQVEAQYAEMFDGNPYNDKIKSVV